MKIKVLISFWVILCNTIIAQNPYSFTVGDNPRPRIIFDTDMGPDYDDIGAISVLHHLADQNECEILATVACVRLPSIAPTIEIFNRYFKRPGIPIGVPALGAPEFTASNNWNDTLIANYPSVPLSKKYPSAVSVYRQALASQPDQSVTILTVGFFSNLSDLLKSGPDKFSKLTGLELIKTKVKLLVAMAGEFPQGNEFNVNKAPLASVHVFDKWPTPVIFSGFEIGAKILTGSKVAKLQDNNPVTSGYKYNLRTYKKTGELARPSWDQTAVLIAVRGPERYFYLNGPGKFMVLPDGRNYWDPDADAKQYFVSHKYPYKQLEVEIDSLMIPKAMSSLE